MTQTAPKPVPPGEEESRGDAAVVTRKSQFGFKGILLGLCLGILVSGISAKLVSGGKSDAPSEPAPTAVPQQVVTTITVEPQALSKTLETVGTVAAVDLVSVMSPRTGLQIIDLFVDEGDRVRAGQPLAQLENATLQAELAQAQAQVTQAQARLAELRSGARPEEVARAQEQVTQAQAAVDRAVADLALADQRLSRNQTLLDAGAIAADSLDEARNRQVSAQANLTQTQATLREAQQRLQELRSGTRPEVLSQADAQLRQAQAQVQLIKTRLQETLIVAPRAGKVIEKFAQVGDLASASQALFSIVEAGELELQAKIPETQLTQIAVGQSVNITADSNAELQLTGTIREVTPTVDPQSRQATLRISLPQENTLQPGMLLRAQIITDRAQGLALPTQAVLPEDGEEAQVFLLNADNTVTATQVQLGELLPNDRVEILSGIQPGDRIVVEGAAYLKDGTLVEIVEPISTTIN